ncbi:MAG TPA: hypothetical protein VFH23_05180 [Jiangellaceae bacterium]|nr:hypothetical protein [Jiangellaceae bacterium]
MTVDGRDYTKRRDAGDALQRLLSGRLTATPPETVGPAVKIGTLGSLPVTGQAITTIADEVRLGIADAHIELTYTREEWQHADPAMIVGRLERHLQRLPDTIAATKAEAQAATAEATRAEARIGQPFEHTTRLVALRRRQQELDEALAATTAPATVGDPQADVESPNSGSASAAVAAVRDRLNALSAPATARSGGISR